MNDTTLKALRLETEDAVAEAMLAFEYEDEEDAPHKQVVRRLARVALEAALGRRGAEAFASLCRGQAGAAPVSGDPLERARAILEEFVTDVERVGRAALDEEDGSAFWPDLGFTYDRAKAFLSKDAAR